MAKRKLINNHILFKKAESLLVGGVDSPVRSFKYVGLEPILIKKGLGSKVYDYDANVYIDYVLSWGALILGHTHPEVIKAVKKAADAGLNFGTTNAGEIELANVITNAAPSIEKIRFVNSGTEAVMSVLRLARGVTKREKILKFENSYHGSADYLLARAGSGLATLNIPISAGVPKDFTKHTLIAPFGDLDFIKRLFQKYGNKIAAVIAEPVGGNHGVVLPDISFLKELRRMTEKYGALLIFDEVITGFRFGYGTAGERFGVRPDLVTLGKIIGGGLPIGAYGGSNEIMKHLAPEGQVYQASTFSGNPVVMQAGIATLKALSKLKNDYQRIEELTKNLSLGIKEEAGQLNIGLDISYFGSMFSIKFRNKGQFKKFYRQLLDQGVYFAPSEFEANFLSFAHTKNDVDKTLNAARAACKISRLGIRG